VAYGIFGTLAEEVHRDPNLKLEVLRGQATQWVSFVDQYDAKSPWSDKRVRLAANHAVNWPAINEAENLGQATLTGCIIPHQFAYALQLEPYGYDPKKATQLCGRARLARAWQRACPGSGGCGPGAGACQGLRPVKGLPSSGFRFLGMTISVHRHIRS